jgi:DNA repair protein RecO
MARRVAVDGVVLRVMDVGEADRFCFLYTKESGKMAVRANGVRKTTSRLGGALLPFRHVKLQLAASDHGATITAATDCGDLSTEAHSLDAFMRLQRGCELVLALTEENEPVRGLFDLLLQFIVLAASEDCDPLPAFQIRLLHLLGLLPSTADDGRFRVLPPDAQRLITAATGSTSLHDLCRMPFPTAKVAAFVDGIFADHVSRPLKAAGVHLG